MTSLFLLTSLLLASCTPDMDAPVIPLHQTWGLGFFLTEEHNNNVGYEWYIDQITTGEHAYVNCGPACAAMAVKWADPNFTGSAQEARNTYLPEGGWWYTSNIAAYLDDHTISWSYWTLPNADNMKSFLDEGNIIILCLDMYYVREVVGNTEWHKDKFYTTEAEEWGHFIVVKGYKVVDGIFWLEVYDPWSLQLRYANGILKGRDRYYRSEDLTQAIRIWWPYMIVINKQTTKTSATPFHHHGVDPSTIIHQRGR